MVSRDCPDLPMKRDQISTSRGSRRMPSVRILETLGLHQPQNVDSERTVYLRYRITVTAKGRTQSHSRAPSAVGPGQGSLPSPRFTESIERKSRLSTGVGISSHNAASASSFRMSSEYGGHTKEFSDSRQPGISIFLTKTSLGLLSPSCPFSGLRISR